MKKIISTGVILYLAFVILFNNGINESNKSLDNFAGRLPVAEDVEALSGMKGRASYYDYVLDSGWSSVGHYVCATRDFIRYSMVRATNVANGKSVECKVTDYGPDASIFPDRIIDLSSTAFAEISSTKLGVVDVIVEQL